MKLFSILSAALFIAQTCLAQQWAREKLESSPRHQEWVLVKGKDREIKSFVVYPEIKDKAPVVVVIHENRGLTFWVRSVADQFAARGCIAIAPDLLSEMAPEKGGTADFPSEDAAREAIYKLNREEVMRDLTAVANFAKTLPAANGKIFVAGYCWGGSQSFSFANAYPELAGAMVFYGSGLETEQGVKDIKAPIYGFYGGNDARVNATIPKSEEAMKKAGKVYEPVIYEGAGHGFMRAGEEPNASGLNKSAQEKAWKRIEEILKGK
ncbi:MAG: dienelactone hydrolase family protein [Verrucomicrobiales bacterium]